MQMTNIIMGIIVIEQSSIKMTAACHGDEYMIYYFCV